MSNSSIERALLVAFTIFALATSSATMTYAGNHKDKDDREDHKSDDEEKEDAVKGALVGAGVGALVGGTEGAIVGGVAGAIIGKNN